VPEVSEAHPYRRRLRSHGDNCGPKKRKKLRPRFTLSKSCPTTFTCSLRVTRRWRQQDWLPWLKSYLPEFVEPFVLHRKRRRGLRNDSQAIHSEAKGPTVTTISCVGCRRTQRLRKNKVVPSDGYLCGVGYGKQNPKFALPRIPEGFVRRTVQNAAAGFSGYPTRFRTPEELAGVSRARGILRRGRNQS
jgi:hypothetical protein